MLLRGTSVRVGVAEPGEYAAFQPLHAPRIALVFVVKALQMQHAVDHQVRVMRVTADTARARLARRHRRANRDVAGKRALIGVSEAQHVGRVIAVAKAAVEPARLARADDAQRDCGAAPERRARPDTQPGAWRQLSGPDAILDRQRELRRPARLAARGAPRRDLPNPGPTGGGPPPL